MFCMNSKYSWRWVLFQFQLILKIFSHIFLLMYLPIYMYMTLDFRNFKTSTYTWLTLELLNKTYIYTSSFIVFTYTSVSYTIYCSIFLYRISFELPWPASTISIRGVLTATWIYTPESATSTPPSDTCSLTSTPRSGAVSSDPPCQRSPTSVPQVKVQTLLDWHSLQRKCQGQFFLFMFIWILSVEKRMLRN